MESWKLLKSKTVHDGWRPVIEKTFLHPKNGETTVEVSGHNDEEDAGVIALDRAGMVIIARQFRCGPEKIMDEIVGGRVDRGESSLDAAVREMKEEVGYKPGTIESLGYVHREAWKGGTSHYFLAIDCEPLASGQQLDGFEIIEVRKITIAELIDNAKNGRMGDAGGVLLAYDKLKELEKKYNETTN